MWANALINASWAVFLVVWVGAAIAQKPKAAEKTAGSGGAPVRLLIAALVLLILNWHSGHVGTQPVPLLRIGSVLTALGVALAVWARFYLGTNWGMPMTKVKAPELVTSGPYAWVRHPIYSGMILAMAGTAVALSWFLVLPLGLMGGYFVYAATQEEARMRHEFGKRYERYMRHTNMLIPWVV